jgi:hypothetical protein
VNALDTMKAASAARRQVTLCLDGALLAEHDELQKAYAQAVFRDQRDGYSEKNPGPLTLAAADAMDEVGARMSASEVAFTFQRLPWAERLALQADHPPRDSNVRDAMEGANTETYMPALVKASCVAVKGDDGETVTDIPDDVWDTVFGQLQIGQFETLFAAAKNANDQAAMAPFSARAFLTSQDSGASSKSRKPGVSPSNGSKAGSRPGRRKSSATMKAESPAS